MRQVYESIRQHPQGRWVVPGFIGVSVLFLFLVFSGDRDYKHDISLHKATSYIEGLRIVNKRDGVDSWVMKARRADFTKDETVAKMDTVSMDIKKEGVVLNAGSGTYNMDSKDLRLEGDVTIHAKDSVIHANSLAWNPSAGKLTTDSRIRVEGEKFTVEGDGLTSTEQNKVTLMRNVKAIFF